MANSFGDESVDKVAVPSGSWFGPLQEFDTRHSRANSLTVRATHTAGSSASQALPQSGNAFGSCASPGGSVLHDASPAASVQGQSWPCDGSMDIDTTLSAGFADCVPRHAVYHQSSFFLSSNQQPLFMATFGMPPGAHPPPSLRPFYDHLQLQDGCCQLSQDSPWSCSISPWA